MKIKHTQLPWEVRKHLRLPCFIQANPKAGMPYRLEIMGDDYEGFGGPEQRQADAEFIVFACNSHEQLIAALKDVMKHADGPAYKIARDALKSVGAA